MSRPVLRAARSLANLGLRPLGFTVERIQPPSDFIQTVDSPVREIIARVAPFTLTGEARVVALCDAVAYIAKHGIPGAIVECGVWRGGSVMAACLTLMGAGHADREVHLFDTFEGMPPAGDKDVETHSGRPANELIARGEVCSAVGETEVRANVASTGYDMGLVHFHRGMVEDTIPREAPEQIAILRLDTDWYASTKHELDHLWHRVSPGGILIIDDYGDYSGARLATDEFFAGRPVFMSRIDHTARLIVKSR